MRDLEVVIRREGNTATKKIERKFEGTTDERWGNHGHGPWPPSNSSPAITRGGDMLILSQNAGKSVELCNFQIVLFKA